VGAASIVPSFTTSESRGYRGEIRLRWAGDIPDDAIQAEVVRRIRSDLDGLRQPSELDIHHIHFSADYCGPAVHVWGEDWSDEFHCRYLPIIHWRSWTAG
jgi:hypothetical protein